MVLILRFLFFVVLACSSISIRAQSPIDSVLLQHLKDISDQYATQPDSAIAIFNSLLSTPQYKNDNGKKSTILISIGREYVNRKREYALALQSFNQSLELARSAQSCYLELRAITHANLVYHALGDMPKFLNNYKNAARLMETCPNYVDAYYIYVQLGLYYEDEKDYRQAEYYFAKTDSAVSATRNLPIDRIIFAYSTIINFYKQLKNNKMVSFYAQKAIKSQVKDKSDEFFNNVFLSNFYENIGELDSAIHYQKCLAQLEFKKHDATYDDFIYKALKNIARNYAQKGDFQNAFLYQTRYTKHLDSLATINKSVKINQQIDLLKTQLENAQQEQKLERHKWLLLLVFILFIVTGIAVYFIYRYNQKLKRLYHQLEDQKQALELQNNIRTKMFLVLSHDLVSPIAALQSMIGLFQRGIVDKTDVKSYTSDMKQHLDALLTTIKSLLDWSLIQLKGDKPIIKPVALRYVVDTQFNLHTSIANQKNIQLINNVPPYFTLLADLNHLNLITRNLIDNAIKYTENNGKITVDAFDTEGGKVLKINDTGIGMSAEEIENILNADKNTINNNQNEAHLGLKMVQDLLVANSYTLSIESKKGVGSVFSIRFNN